MTTLNAQSAPRFTGPATFFRLPYVPDPRDWTTLDIGVLGIPFDGGTTNRPGARHGPRAVREYSTMIAPWNSAMDLNPFLRCSIADVGDAWPSEPFALEPSLAAIEAHLRRLVECGVMPLSVGGDHSISYPILKAIGASGPVGMIHIDAHCDTGMGYMGSRFHHGAPFSRAVEAGVLDPHRTIQIGIRGPLNDSSIWAFSRTSGMRVIEMDEVDDRGIDEVIGEARAVIGDGPCYLSFDIDALDPAFAPGTGTPVIGGFTSREVLRLLRGLRGLQFVGADLVEVATSRHSPRRRFSPRCCACSRRRFQRARDADPVATS